MINKNWLIIGILTFITICAWVAFDIFHSRANVEIPPETQTVIEPITPTFDTKSIESTPIQPGSI